MTFVHVTAETTLNGEKITVSLAVDRDAWRDDRGGFRDFIRKELDMKLGLAIVEHLGVTYETRDL